MMQQLDRTGMTRSDLELNSEIDITCSCKSMPYWNNLSEITIIVRHTKVIISRIILHITLCRVYPEACNPTYMAPGNGPCNDSVHLIVKLYGSSLSIRMLSRQKVKKITSTLISETPNVDPIIKCLCLTL